MTIGFGASGDLPARLVDLSIAYTHRYKSLQEVQDLNLAIEYKSRLVQITSEDNQNLPRWVTSLGISYTERYKRLGETGDLERAIECDSRAVTLTPSGHPDLPSRLINLASSYEDRYERLNELRDLDRAIENRLRAVELTPSRSEFPRRLAGLGLSYSSRFERLGKLVDLEEAIKYEFLAVESTSENDPSMAERLSNLGISYTNRHQRSGESGDLEKSIQYKSHALELTPTVTLTFPTGCLKSIEYIHRAIDITPNDHRPPKPACWSRRVLYPATQTCRRLCEIAVSCTQRYRRLGEIADLENAIEYDSRAVALTPEDHPEFPSQLGNLGASYEDRYLRLGEPDDLAKAIKYISRALELMPNDHQDVAAWCTGLGSCYADRYIRIGALSDLSKAIEYKERALRLTPDTIRACHTSSPIWHRPTMININASKISMIFRKPSNLNLVDLHLLPTATQVCRVYLGILVFITTIGIEAWRTNDPSQLANSLDSFRKATQIFNGGPRDIFYYAFRWAKLASRHNPSILWKPFAQQLIYFLKNLAGRAASAAILSSEYNLALEWMEHARCVVWNQSLMLRTALDDLSTSFPDLANRLQRLARQLNEATSDPVGSDRVISTSAPEYRHALARRYNDLLAQSGHPTEGRGRDGNKSKKPVLSFLGYLEDVPIGSTIPHVTWCPTGAVSFLPLHAAGDYDKPDARSFKYVVSSYTPNLTTLLSSSSSALGPGSRVLGVGQEATSYQGNLSKLPGTTRELGYLKEQVQKIKSVGFSELTDENATTKAVLDAMENHDWVHLACHAHQNVDDPSESGFLLHDGILDLASINRRSFKNKGLAFLSACQTATGDSKLPDEAVHLASGMLMAGYSSVIATMWSVKDADAPLVANEVYSQLMRDGKLGKGEAGRALHRAIAELRGKIGENEFGRWVPYIHIGS
ncbi:TPR-like protein [Rhizoctonia solani]|uniref:TPR-like protein n=1 Tax=Rhizoctonia solani TaxID=456999 RepID=A0A8H7I6D2_9AGAM|nr:TPR-like protein [Rhizoctonia solani]